VGLLTDPSRDHLFRICPPHLPVQFEGETGNDPIGIVLRLGRRQSAVTIAIDIRQDGVCHLDGLA